MMIQDKAMLWLVALAVWFYELWGEYWSLAVENEFKIG